MTDTPTITVANLTELMRMVHIYMRIKDPARRAMLLELAELEAHRTSL